ncbi:MAG: HAD family hydrolase [Chloroflexota bacterium]
MTTFLYPPSLQTLLFDLDGTLLDSFAAHYGAYEIMLPQFGVEVSKERFFEVYSPDWLETYRLLGLPEALWEEADEVWLEAVRTIECKPFPEAEAVLAQLAKRFKLGLITSGSKDRVHRDLAQTNLSDFFEVIITGGDVDRPKPDPQGIHLALAALGMEGETAVSAVYIGDTLVDYETARAAGLPFIGIVGHFQAFPPDANFPRLNGISELLSLLKTI